MTEEVIRVFSERLRKRVEPRNIPEAAHMLKLSAELGKL